MRSLIKSTTEVLESMTDLVLTAHLLYSTVRTFTNFFEISKMCYSSKLPSLLA